MRKVYVMMILLGMVCLCMSDTLPDDNDDVRIMTDDNDETRFLNELDDDAINVDAPKSAVTRSLRRTFRHKLDSCCRKCNEMETNITKCQGYCINATRIRLLYSVKSSSSTSVTTSTKLQSIRKANSDSYTSCRNDCDSEDNDDDDDIMCRGDCFDSLLGRLLKEPTIVAKPDTSHTPSTTTARTASSSADSCSPSVDRVLENGEWIVIPNAVCRKFKAVQPIVKEEPPETEDEPLPQCPPFRDGGAVYANGRWYSGQDMSECSLDHPDS